MVKLLKKTLFALECLFLLIVVQCTSATLTSQHQIGIYGSIGSNSKKIFFRTTHWLLDSSYYGLHGSEPNAIPALINSIHASTVTVYYKETDMSDWQWQHLKANVNTLKSMGLEVWIMMMKTTTTLTETAGTISSVQYVIDEFAGNIEGIIFDAWDAVNPTLATNWLLAKKVQLDAYGLGTAYYHGDGFAPDYGNPATDVNATYLSSQGIIPMAWLQNDNSWKPGTFNLPKFWFDYDILAGTSWGGPTGQSYAEIYTQWYLGKVIGVDNLKNNAGAEALVFMCYNNEDYPNLDALNGMVATANDWLGLSS